MTDLNSRTNRNENEVVCIEMTDVQVRKEGVTRGNENVKKNNRKQERKNEKQRTTNERTNELMN